MKRLYDPKLVWPNLIVSALISIPVFSLAVNAISWLRFGIDLPFWDDWGGYLSHKMSSLDLAYLFEPRNDTISAVGTLLDALAQRYLDGNAVAYQFISLVLILGSLLALQWRLLSLALRERLLVASAFSLSVFILQPETYWGLQNMGYWHALPLVCMLGALALILAPRWSSLWGAPAVLVLGLLSGFTYISGAFGALAIAMVILFFAPFLDRSERRPLIWGGLSLLTGALVAVVAQLRLIIIVHQWQIHRPDITWTLPTEGEFWIYLLGNMARATGLNAFPPTVAFPLVFVIIAALLVSCAVLLRRTCQRRMGRLSDARLAIAFVAVVSVVTTYLFMIAAGRASFFSPAPNSPIELFAMAQKSYRFYWASLLWPWLAAVIIHFASKLGRVGQGAVAIVLPIMILPVAYAAGVFNHAAYYRGLADWRSETQVACLQDKLRRGDSLLCPSLFPSPITSGYIHALDIGASFTRIFPLLPTPVGTTDPPPMFRLSDATSGSIASKNIRSLEHTADGLEIDAGQDAMIFFLTGASAQLRNCAVLEVSARLWVHAADSVQLFYLPQGQSEFTEPTSSRRPIAGSAAGMFTDISFIVHNMSGFEDGFRLDPVCREQHIILKDIEVRCRLTSSSYRNHVQQEP